MSSNTSRRSLIVSAAALPAPAVPALATAAKGAEPDPIFAAIEVHKKAACVIPRLGSERPGARDVPDAV